MSTSRGYEAVFVSSVPDYLKCIICHHVLREALQIMTCGHRLCEACYNYLVDQCTRTRINVCCPIDRQVIEEKCVFKDKGMDRIVGDLAVRCSDVRKGCDWRGELRERENHARRCNFNRDTKGHQENKHKTHGSGSLESQSILARLNEYEKGMLAKEKDLAHLKFNLQQAKDETKGVKRNMEEMKKNMEEMKEEKRKMKKRINTLEENCSSLERKVRYLENQIKRTEVNHQVHHHVDVLEDRVQFIEDRIDDCQNQFLGENVHYEHDGYYSDEHYDDYNCGYGPPPPPPIPYHYHPHHYGYDE